MKNWHTWNDKRLKALLTRIYHFLKTTDIPIAFDTELCQIVSQGEKDTCDGFVLMKKVGPNQREPEAILFDPRPSQSMLVVFVHELVHAIYPQLEEYQVAHITEQATTLMSDRRCSNLFKRVIEKIK